MTLGSLRRSRLLALFLALASPAAAGTVLPVIHPCPVDSPWLADQAASGHAGHHSASHHSSAADRQPAHCHCIGSCAAAVAATAPPPAAPVAVAATSSAPIRHGPDATLDLAPVSALLPPSTAPPRA